MANKITKTTTTTNINDDAYDDSRPDECGKKSFRGC